MWKWRKSSKLLDRNCYRINYPLIEKINEQEPNVLIILLLLKQNCVIDLIKNFS
ncbi:hypothetical protein [Wolbachia endosymbiont of Onchocerca gibsoni]|uniref:hypothetical protein n=1 Tax=Wolbachia endosymbiont of Onchocerca gibsoni TaxID=118986 RepID=UPI0023D85E62|nr:hypothetical protein [Wolbachia endosymbiont of Onchocerca gibsoni]